MKLSKIFISTLVFYSVVFIVVACFFITGETDTCIYTHDIIFAILLGLRGFVIPMMGAFLMVKFVCPVRQEKKYLFLYYLSQLVNGAFIILYAGAVSHLQSSSGIIRFFPWVIVGQEWLNPFRFYVVAPLALLGLLYSFFLAFIKRLKKAAFYYICIIFLLNNGVSAFLSLVLLTIA